MAEHLRDSVTQAEIDLDGEFTLEELEECLEQAQFGKACGNDETRNEMFKCGGATMRQLLLRVFNFLRDIETTPDDWGMGTLVNLYKDGDPADLGNYRGIALMSYGLWERLWQSGIRGRAWRIIRDAYRGIRMRVLVDGCLTQPVPVSQGVRQGDPLSPVLFLIFIDALAEMLAERCKGLAYSPEGPATRRQLRSLLYADDVVMLTESPEELNAMIEVVRSFCDTWRIEINLAKSQVMEVHPRGVCRKAEGYYYGSKAIEVVVTVFGVQSIAKFSYFWYILYGVDKRLQTAQNILHDREQERKREGNQTNSNVELPRIEPVRTPMERDMKEFILHIRVKRARLQIRRACYAMTLIYSALVARWLAVTRSLRGDFGPYLNEIQYSNQLILKFIFSVLALVLATYFYLHLNQGIAIAIEKAEANRVSDNQLMLFPVIPCGQQVALVLFGDQNEQQPVPARQVVADPANDQMDVMHEEKEELSTDSRAPAEAAAAPVPHYQERPLEPERPTGTKDIEERQERHLMGYYNHNKLRIAHDTKEIGSVVGSRGSNQNLSVLSSQRFVRATGRDDATARSRGSTGRSKPRSSNIVATTNTSGTRAIARDDVLIHVDVDASRGEKSINLDQVDKEKLRELIAFHGATPLSKYEAILSERLAKEGKVAVAYGSLSLLDRVQSLTVLSRKVKWGSYLQKLINHPQTLMDNKKSLLRADAENHPHGAQHCCLQLGEL
eukprot:g48737.t1